MERKVVLTSDGSTTIHLPEWNENYHSKHGAIQEAYHVFIKNGLGLYSNSTISILEMGFGTGLNCFITFLESLKLNLKINYYGVEKYPISLEEVKELNYVDKLNGYRYNSEFVKMHLCDWGVQSKISKDFVLNKLLTSIENVNFSNEFDLIYFDAFGPRVQPDLWTETIFSNMYKALKPNGVLVTYSAKGSVRRAMKEVGFFVEKLPGPPGKREMLRAKKL